jgi:hypothetical protein
MSLDYLGRKRRRGGNVGASYETYLETTWRECVLLALNNLRHWAKDQVRMQNLLHFQPPLPGTQIIRQVGKPTTARGPGGPAQMYESLIDRGTHEQAPLQVYQRIRT